MTMETSDVDFIRALHEQLHSLRMLKGLQDHMIKESQETEIITDPMEIEKAFREDDL
jgi:hypothetical protein